jgi:hypothetical protein
MLCRSGQIVRMRPAMPCRNVTARRPETTVNIPLGGTGASNSTAAPRGTESTGLHYYGSAPTGQQPPGDQERDLLIASIDELTPEDRRHVAALVESLRNRTSTQRADR